MRWLHLITKQQAKENARNSWCCVHVCRVQEASISWEKRQAQVRAKLQQDTDAAAWNSWWENLGGEGLLLSMSGAACCNRAACP